jgi:putative transposase
MTNHRRHFVAGGSYFFTESLAEHGLSLLIEHVNALRAAFRYVRSRYPFAIDAIVVLPDHLHAMWTLPEGDGDFPVRWRLIKANFSRSLRSGEALSSSRLSKGERGIWQRRYWEHALCDDDDFARHADYIHFNPSSMAMCGRRRIGHIRHSIAWCDWARTPRTGRAHAMNTRGAVSASDDGFRCAQPILHVLYREIA